MIERAVGVQWYEEVGNDADLAALALCRLRRSRAGLRGGPAHGDAAVREALSAVDPAALTWIASRAISYLDENGFPEALEPFVEPCLLAISPPEQKPEREERCRGEVGRQRNVMASLAPNDGRAAARELRDPLRRRSELVLVEDLAPDLGGEPLECGTRARVRAVGGLRNAPPEDALVPVPHVHEDGRDAGRTTEELREPGSGAGQRSRRR